MGISFILPIFCKKLDMTFSLKIINDKKLIGPKKNIISHIRSVAEYFELESYSFKKLFDLDVVITN